MHKRNLTRNPNRGKHHAARMAQRDPVTYRKPRKSRAMTAHEVERALLWYTMQNGATMLVPANG